MSHITLLGLGPVSASLGLGLKSAGIRTEIVGTDRDRGPLVKASKMGAIDRLTGNLRSAMDGAQLVVLDVSHDEAKEMLEAIGPILDDGCVVTDTGSTKVQIAEWAESALRPGVSFVGGHPLITEHVTEVADADPALLKGVDYCIIPGESANPAAVKTVVGMVEAVGAKPLFLDAREHDSYSAAMAQLPMILSAALISSTSSGASWREVSRLAGPEFRGLSQLASLDPRDSASTCLANPEFLAYWLDQMIAELTSYRDQVKDGGEPLVDSFIHAWEQWAKWQAGAIVEEEAPDLPSASQHMAGIFVGHRWTERAQKAAKAEKRPSWRFPGRR